MKQKNTARLFPLDVALYILFMAGGVAAVFNVDNLSKILDVLILLMLLLIGIIYHKRSVYLIKRRD